jgi:predicted RNA binding protein YcfA (HicA-like mRNA interferase family)
MARPGMEQYRATQHPGGSVAPRRMPKFTPQPWRAVEAVFLAAGFSFARQEGSHRSYVKAGVARPIVIPAYKEVPVFIIRNNLKTAGLSRDDYFALLGKVK